MLAVEATSHRGGSGHQRASGGTSAPETLRRRGVQGNSPKQQTPGVVVAAGRRNVSRATSLAGHPVTLRSRFIQNLPTERLPSVGLSPRRCPAYEAKPGTLL